MFARKQAMALLLSSLGLLGASAMGASSGAGAAGTGGAAGAGGSGGIHSPDAQSVRKTDHRQVRAPVRETHRFLGSVSRMDQPR